MEKITQIKKIVSSGYNNPCSNCGKIIKKGENVFLLTWGKYDPESANETAIVCSEFCRDEMICKDIRLKEPLP